MSHQGHFPISNRDVICLTAASEAVIEPKGGSTHRIQDLLAKFAETLGVSASRLSSNEMASLIADGIPCELLQPGQDWQSGQLQMSVSFSFVPGAIAAQPTKTQAMVETPAAETPAAETPMVEMPAAEMPAAATSAEIPMAAIAAPAALGAIGLAATSFTMPEAEESFDMTDFQLDIDPMIDISAVSEMPAAPADDEAFSTEALDASLNDDRFDADNFDMESVGSDFADSDFADSSFNDSSVDPNDGMVAAALDDMGGLDDLDAGFGDMPSFRDTSAFEDIDPEVGTLSNHPQLGMPAMSFLDSELEAQPNQDFSSEDLDCEGDRFTGDELDAALDLALPTSSEAAFSLEEDDIDSFDFGDKLDMSLESPAMEAPITFEAQPDFNLESELEASFDLGDDDLLADAFLGEDDMLGDGLSEDLGDLAMDAAKLDVLSPTSIATQVPDSKVTRAIDTESLDELGFGMLDNPWDLSDDLDSMLLAQPPLG